MCASSRPAHLGGPCSFPLAETSLMPFPFLLAVQSSGAQAVAAPIPDLSTGAWIGLITLAVTFAGILVGFGATIQDVRNTKKNTTDAIAAHKVATDAAIAAVNLNVERELHGISASLERLLAGQQESLKRQIEDAGWRATMEADVTRAQTRADAAYAIADALRERRTGDPDRRD